jgi:tetratricopeptide (TPR) repeat protein
MRLRVSVPTGSEPLSAEHYATFYELAFMTDQNIDLAIRVFEETQRRPQLPSPSAACYQSLAMIYAKHKSTHQAISAVMEWADKLPDDPPTQLAYSYLLTEAANRKQMDYAAEILREMQRRGVHGSQTTYNLLLKLLIANRGTLSV